MQMKAETCCFASARMSAAISHHVSHMLVARPESGVRAVGMVSGGAPI